MKFQRIGDEMVLSKPRSIIEEMTSIAPISTAYIVDIPRAKESIKSGNFLKNMNFAVAPITIGATKGVFWGAFLTYIFPWMLDIAKVFCAIKIAQAFYQERRGGRDEGTGMSALVQYGKWYLVFWLIPWGVTLIDEIGQQMFTDLVDTPVGG